MPEDNKSTEMTKEVLRVGTRKSELALVQTHHVIDLLTKLNPQIQFEVVKMSTVGDNILDVALSKIGEKSLFTKELEIALEKKEVDFVVHSLKDLPTILPDGMVIGSILEREDPRDAVILKKDLGAKSLQDLSDGSVIGTSSLRRAAQLMNKFPRLKFQDVRGNLNTRLRKLDNPEGEYSALILAVAGVTRMGWSERISEYLEADVCMHAVGQGALAVECRVGDTDTLHILSRLNHRTTVLAAVAERSFLKKLEGGCSVPVAVTSSVTASEVTLTGGVWSLDGSENLTAKRTESFSPTDEGDGGNGTAAPDSAAPPAAKQPRTVVSYAAISADNVASVELEAAARCGLQLAEELIKRGAEKILREAKAASEKK